MTTDTAGKMSAADVPANRRRGGDVRLLLSPRTVRATSGFGGVMTLEDGDYVCEHYHPYSEEFVYVTEGEVVLRIEGEDLVLRPDDAAMVPIGARHRMENRSGAPAKLVFQCSPLAPSPELGHVDTEQRPDRAGESGPEVGGTP